MFGANAAKRDHWNARRTRDLTCVKKPEWRVPGCAERRKYRREYARIGAR